MSRMDDSEPKMQIPETWAAKMACPVCGSRPLGVFHPTGHADRFVCQSCETSFEIEDVGTRVRFITLPQGVTPWLRGSWTSLEEALSAFAAHQNDTLAIPDAQPATPADSMTAEPAQTPINLPAVTPVSQVVGEPVSKPMDEPNHKPAEDVAPQTVENAQPEIQMPSPPEPISSSGSSTATIEEPRHPAEPPQNTPQVPSFMANVIPLNPPEDESQTVTNSPSPFYKDDIDIPGIYPDKIRSELEKPAEEVWKNLEDERVKNLYRNTFNQKPSSGLTQNDFQTIQPDSQIGSQIEANPTGASIQPFSQTESDKTSQVVEENIDLDNLPPINTVEDTPPALVSEPRTIPRSSVSPDDLGILRSQISGQAIMPTLNEKMQAASLRALELQRLGNTENEVRSILERSSGLTPEEVAQVIKSLDKPEERKRSSRILFAFLAIALAIFSMIAWWFLSSITQEVPANQEPGAVETESSSLLPGELVSAESLPAPLQTLIPNGIRILNDAPAVEISSVDELPVTTCPKSKTEAATLFGGPAEDWNTEEKNNGWVLVTQRQSVVIKVPTNMTAGYLVFEKGPEMRSVAGPAIVRNIYMISISCQ